MGDARNSHTIFVKESQRKRELSRPMTHGWSLELHGERV